MLRTEPLPIMFEPCIPATSDRLPSGPGWVHEIKHDGFRLMAYPDDGGICLLTRNGHDWADRGLADFNELRRALLQKRAPHGSSTPSI